RAVKIVGVDHREGTVQRLAGAPDRVAHAPGLLPAGGQPMPLRQGVERLKNVVHLHLALEPRADRRAELRLKIAPDDEEHPVETGAHRVVNRVVQNRLAGRPHGINLLEPAVAGAHACGQDDEGELHGRNVKLNPSCLQQNILLHFEAEGGLVSKPCPRPPDRPSPAPSSKRTCGPCRATTPCRWTGRCRRRARSPPTSVPRPLRCFAFCSSWRSRARSGSTRADVFIAPPRAPCSTGPSRWPA